ncbi:DNA polymerase III subunit gamma and tau, partial [Streptomyces sp. NPDC059070]
PQAPQAPAPAPAPGAGGGPGSAVHVRNMWPDILEAVKNKRRFTWILLSQNAQVAGFDGTTLQLGFINAGARDNFASSGSEEVLRGVLGERFGVQWKVEAIIDPSGGSQPPAAAANFGGGAPSGGYGGAPSGGYGAPAPSGGYGAPQGGGHAPAPQAPAPSAQPAAPQSPPPPAPAHQQAPPAVREAPPVRPEDDVPEDDDPDLVDNALSGHDLIVRELGATVVEEYTNE